MTTLSDGPVTGVRPVDTAVIPIVRLTPPEVQHDTGPAAIEPQPAEPAQPSAPTADAAVEDRPRNIGVRTVDERASVIGSALGSLGLVWLLYERVLLWSGTLGFVVCWWLVYLAMYVGSSMLANDRPTVGDRLASAVVTSGAALVGFALLTTISYTVFRGWPALTHWNFFTKDMSGVPPTSSLDRGGILHALTGTLIEVLIATAISLPLGIGTAVYLTEVGGRMSATVRTVVEAMTALPDVLAGLFVYALLIITLGADKNGFAAAVALAVTMTPVMARSAEVVLRIVPSGLREAGLALGASQWQTVWRVVLPTAKSGIATSLILGVARIAGETAPLLIVSGATSFFNDDPLHGRMNSLPLFVYAAVKSGQGKYIDRGYGAATVLLLTVLVLFVLTRFLARNKAGSR